MFDIISKFVDIEFYIIVTGYRVFVILSFINMYICRILRSVLCLALAILAFLISPGPCFFD